jgi:cell division protein FtsB
MEASPMDLVAEIRRRLRFMIGPILGLSAICYFAYHAVQGERGILAWRQLERQVGEAQTELSQIRAQREVLEHRVKLLHYESLDADLLDEVVRRNLGYGRRDEIVIRTPGVSRDQGQPPPGDN